MRAWEFGLNIPCLRLLDRWFFYFLPVTKGRKSSISQSSTSPPFEAEKAIFFPSGDQSILSAIESRPVLTSLGSLPSLETTQILPFDA